MEVVPTGLLPSVIVHLQSGSNRAARRAGVTVCAAPVRLAGATHRPGQVLSLARFLLGATQLECRGRQSSVERFLIAIPLRFFDL